MAYRPTGRAPGRPRKPVTPAGRLDQARKALPHVRAFPRMRQAVDRALLEPNEVIYREDTADSREVRLVYRYTPAERGQILAFTWWVYVNRSSWGREKLRAAVTAVSPLMFFSSAFLMEMTGMPRTTTQKCMIKSPDMPAARVTGSCDMWAIHRLLSSAAEGMDEFREAVRELSLTKGVPSAILSRISGVPCDILRRPERGIQFFPEAPDLATGSVCSPEQCELFAKYTPRQEKKWDPSPASQKRYREALWGTPLVDLRATSTPVSGEDPPYHLSIPGLPSLRDASKLGSMYYKQIRDWEHKYFLPFSFSK